MKKASHVRLQINTKIPYSKYAQLSNASFRYANCVVKLPRYKENDKHEIQESSYLWREKKGGLHRKQ